MDLRSQVKQACWNVKGHDFSQLHALFATMATELDAYTDLVAERIVMLGGAGHGPYGGHAVEEAGSAAVYTDISRGVDKQLWVLEAHLYH